MNMQDLHDAPDDASFQIGDRVLSKAGVIAHLKEKQLGVQLSIVRQRDEWVQHRSQSGVEDRWRKGKALFEGEEVRDSNFVTLLKDGPQGQKNRASEAARSKVVINIVRPKVEQAWARMCEIVLPVDDRNWGIGPTPVPDLVSQMLGDTRPTVDPATGQPTGLTADQEAQHVVKEAEDASDAMQKAIDDPLTECNYNAEQRDGLKDGVQLGTMILLGPFPAKESTKSWKSGADGTREMIIGEKIVPASQRADPWDVWFDPACGNNHQRGAGFWHRRYATKKELRALRGLPGYDDDALRTVLMSAPTRIRMADGRVSRMAAKEAAYELWTYHGDIEPDDMAMCSLNTGDPLEDVEFGVVMMVNDTVIGAMPSWIPDKTLPCDVWNWRKSDDSPYGFGLPHELEHQQRVVTAAWRMVMDGAGSAGGSQIVMLDGVVPVDGSMTITRNKVWKVDATKAGNDVAKAFTIVDFPDNIDKFLSIVKVALEMADAETSMPQIMGGEKGSAPETVGGMVMLYNNANVVLRMRVKLYDDDITQPHISRHFDWQMMNNPDPKIKGDMQIVARGSTALLEKDIQNQATLNLANVTNNPRYAAYLDIEAELKTILKAFKIQPETIMATDEQIKKNLSAPPPVDPKTQLVNAQLKIAEDTIKDKQAQRQFDADAATKELGFKEQTLQYDKERDQANNNAAMTETQNTRDLAELAIASKEKITAAQLETNTGIKHLEIDTERQLFNADAALKVAQGSGVNIPSVK